MTRYLLPILLILLGILALIFRSSFWDFSSTDPLVKVLNSTHDSAQFRSRISVELKPIKKYLGHRDILISNSSTVSLEVLNSDLMLDVLKDSIVIFKKVDSNLVMTFLEGNFMVTSQDFDNYQVSTGDIITLTIDTDSTNQIYELADDITAETEPEDPYINGVMSRHSDLFKRCYQRLLKNDPTHEGGYVSMAFVVSLSGYVSYIKLADSSIPDFELHKCVERVIKSIRFKKLEHDLFITYPIKFK